MANCPKCKAHLKLTDWKQHCPHCGANIVLYDIQERLMQDADKAELQYYYSHKKVERMKAAFVGTRLAVARLVLFLVPILAIVVPFLSGCFKTPFAEFEGVFSLFSLIGIMENINTDAILGLINTSDGKTPIIMLGIALILFVLSIVLVLARFLCLMMACSPKGKIRNYTFDISLLVITIIGSVLLVTIPENPYFNIDFIIAPIVYFILLAVSFGIDIVVFKNGIEVKYEDCLIGGIPAEEYLKMKNNGISDEDIRQEMYKRLTELQQEQLKEVAQ